MSALLLPFCIYIFFGVLVYFYELGQGSNWGFCVFLAIFYPITIMMGGAGWICYGIYWLACQGFKVAQIMWSSKLFQKISHEQINQSDFSQDDHR